MYCFVCYFLCIVCLFLHFYSSLMCVCVCTFDQINTSIICFVFPLRFIYCFAFLLFLFDAFFKGYFLFFSIVCFNLFLLVKMLLQFRKSCVIYFSLINFWICCFESICFPLFLFQARGQLDTHTHAEWFLFFFCFKLIDLRFQFCLRWGSKSVCHMYIYGHVLFVLFGFYAVCFKRVCDGSGFVLLIYVCFFLNLSVCWFFLTFSLSYVNVFVWVNFSCYCFSCEWSRSLFILKNIISLFFIMTANVVNGFCRRFLYLLQLFVICYRLLSKMVEFPYQ